MSTTIPKLAQEAYDAMEAGERTNGEKFLRFRAADYDRFTPLSTAAHDDGEVLPDDYRYRFMRDALATLADCDDDADEDTLSDRLLEAADSDVDAYTSDLTAWLDSSNARVYYLSEVLSEYGGDLMDAIRADVESLEARGDPLAKAWRRTLAQIEAGRKAPCLNADGDPTADPFGFPRVNTGPPPLPARYAVTPWTRDDGHEYRTIEVRRRNGHTKRIAIPLADVAAVAAALAASVAESPTQQEVAA